MDINNLFLDLSNDYQELLIQEFIQKIENYNSIVASIQLEENIIKNKIYPIVNEKSINLEKLAISVLTEKSFITQGKISVVIQYLLNKNIIPYEKAKEILSIPDISYKIFYGKIQDKVAYVIKKSKVNLKNLIHEALIGIYAINNLRQYLPTFAFTYAFHNNKIIMEKVNGIDLEFYFCKMTFTEFLEILIQIFSALALAYKKFNFTHYDLHIGNILIEKLEYKKTVPIYYEDKNYQLNTQVLVHIIDFETSFATINGVNFGVPRDLIEFQIYSDKPYPSFDIYKFFYSFGSCIYNLDDECNDFFNSVCIFLKLNFILQPLKIVKKDLSYQNFLEFLWPYCKNLLKYQINDIQVSS